MKKLIAIILSLAAILAFAACKNDSSDESKSPAKRLLDEFYALDTSLSASDIAEKLSELDWLPFSGAYMPVEEGYLNGFTEQITGFDEGAVFSPSIGSIPFIGYVFKVSGGTEDFVDLLKASYDLRWNVCTQADEMVCGAKGDTVVFVMSPADFED